MMIISNEVVCAQVIIVAKIFIRSSFIIYFFFKTGILQS